MADYNDIKQSIATNLPDNNKREITAARLRDTLNGFVDKVQETETGIEGKVSTNETNVTNLTGRVDSLEQTVENLPSGEAVKVIDNPGFGGVKDAVSARLVNTIGAIAGIGAVDYRERRFGLGFKIGKATVHPGYLNGAGNIENIEGYSYFEYELSISSEGRLPSYITVPAYGGSIVDSLPEGKELCLVFYKGDQRMGYRLYDSYYYQVDILPHEYVVPYGITKVRGSLVNGTFDPDGVYVVESDAPSGVLGSKNANENVVNQRLATTIVARINSTYGNMETADSEVTDRMSIIRLLKNDELAVYTDDCAGARFSVADSAALWEHKTVIYNGGYFTGRRGWVFYKADRDCYAFIANAQNFRIIHNSPFNDDLQYQLNALIKKIDPSIGEVVLEDDGKGLYWDYASGTKIVCKVPIIAGSTLNYTLHSTGTFTLGPVAYYYNGQPVATENIENQATFNANVLGIVGGTKSGYMLVTFVYSGEGDIPAEIFNATYLEKNA